MCNYCNRDLYYYQKKSISQNEEIEKKEHQQGGGILMKIPKRTKKETRFIYFCYATSYVDGEVRSIDLFCGNLMTY